VQSQEKKKRKNESVKNQSEQINKIKNHTHTHIQRHAQSRKNTRALFECVCTRWVFFFLRVPIGICTPNRNYNIHKQRAPVCHPALRPPSTQPGEWSRKRGKERQVL